jgi:hypothetical protein
MHTDVNVPRILQGKFDRGERTLKDGKTLQVIDEYDPTTKKVKGLRRIS